MRPNKADILASAFPTRHGSADCSSFFSKTVTPGPTTVTTTITTTVPALAAAVQARQAIAAPSSIPPYASACSGTARYASACSCIGVTPTTKTAAAPIVTVTATVTVTNSSPNPAPTFLLRLVGSGLVLNGVPLDGTFGTIDDGDGELVGFNGDAGADAAYFTLNAAGNLVMLVNGFIGYQDAGQTAELMHFNPRATVVAAGEVPAVCAIVGGALKCATDGNSVFVLCPGFAVTDDLFLVSVVQSGCTAVTIDAIVVP
ncbi:hypothetical protein MMC18_004428 [Xylographa bjoerkii]|nr:hypothetical protein [Xylographa bjoerkii]